ncbi:MAG TPA: radical SAM protein [Methanoregulaceae archaeon]|nr:radical SAM protein [Methanoregulaceae archaeon]
MNVLEIFYSIQGEGKKQGRPTIFVRLAGCNLACRWCDTPAAHDRGYDLTLSEVIGKIREFRCREICITGGEPLLQEAGLLDLLKLLSSLGYSIEIETNGTIDFSWCQEHATICMDVKCPSSGEESMLSLLGLIREQDSVKFVVGDERDCQYAEEVIMASCIRGEVFLSPVWGSDMGKVASFVLEHGLPVRVQVQLHKVLGVS